MDSDAPDQQRYATCPNCGERIEGPYCYQCGQNQRRVDRFFMSLVNEAFDDVFSFDSRIVKTLTSLFFRPGFLTVEYFAGRRARYVQPLRLYLITSVIFFFYLSVQPGFSDPVVIQDNLVIEDQEQRNEMLDKEMNLELPWISAALEQKLEGQLKKARDDPDQLRDSLLDLAPPIMFLIMPLFAAFLKLGYLGTGRYYAEHLVLAVHNHSFMFVALLASDLLELFQGTLAGVVTTPLNAVLLLWIPVYMYISLRRTYHQGHGMTLIKFFFLTLAYQILFLAGILAALFRGLLTL